MRIQFLQKDFNEVLTRLNDRYDLYAPVRLKSRGRFSDQDLIGYGKVQSLEEIVLAEKSHFSPKEVVFPITQRLFRFAAGEIKEEPACRGEDAPLRPCLIFLRACDLHGMARLDSIFLQNGPFKDLYYQQLRETVKFVIMECPTSFENCFCVSMGTNIAKDYSMAIGINGDTVSLDIPDTELTPYFEKQGKSSKFQPAFVKENTVKVTPPTVSEMPKSMYSDPLWDEYARRCIACGRCNTMCPTCSCFSTKDIYEEGNPSSGERHRVWDGCHLNGFSTMAGGHDFRKDNGARMRFKAFHKVYDFHKRFGIHMCVGCGRCDDNCPEYISFSTCINKVTEALEKSS